MRRGQCRIRRPDGKGKVLAKTERTLLAVRKGGEKAWMDDWERCFSWEGGGKEAVPSFPILFPKGGAGSFPSSVIEKIHRLVVRRENSNSYFTRHRQNNGRTEKGRTKLYHHYFLERLLVLKGKKKKGGREKWQGTISLIHHLTVKYHI